MGNSSGQPAAAVLLIGSQEAPHSPTSFGGALHIEPLLAAAPITLPGNGLIYQFFAPNMPGLFCDFCIQLQTVQTDNGATHRLAFSRALELVLGR